MNWQRHNNNFILIIGRNHVATVFRKGDDWGYALVPESRPCPLKFESCAEAKRWCLVRLERCYPEIFEAS